MSVKEQFIENAKDGKVLTSLGRPFSIVHQYDRVPEWRKLIEVKYG